MTQTQPKSKRYLVKKDCVREKYGLFVIGMFKCLPKKNEITIITTLKTIMIKTITIKITINNNNNDDDKTSTRQGKRS